MQASLLFSAAVAHFYLSVSQTLTRLFGHVGFWDGFVHFCRHFVSCFGQFMSLCVHSMCTYWTTYLKMLLHAECIFNNLLRLLLFWSHATFIYPCSKKSKCKINKLHFYRTVSLLTAGVPWSELTFLMRKSAVHSFIQNLLLFLLNLHETSHSILTCGYFSWPNCISHLMLSRILEFITDQLGTFFGGFLRT